MAPNSGVGTPCRAREPQKPVENFHHKAFGQSLCAARSDHATTPTDTSDTPVLLFYCQNNN